MNPFADRLCDAVVAKRTPVMVGVDPRWSDLPEEVRERSVEKHGRIPLAVADAYLDFSKRVLDVVADLVPIVKFQAAFFEAAGPVGMLALSQAMIHAHALGLLVVLDGKRNDIGSTAEAYAQAYLGELTFDGEKQRVWFADAMTINPYLGSEGIEPFLKAAKEHHAGLFVLVRTSNPGAGTLQDRDLGGKRVYEEIADWVEAWSAETTSATGRYGAVGAVVGATVPAQVGDLRRRMPHVPILLPGYGAQGGSAKDTADAFDADGLGAVVNNSRGILFAHKDAKYSGIHWQDAVRRATQAMIDDLAANTPAGKLR